MVSSARSAWTIRRFGRGLQLRPRRCSAARIPVWSGGTLLTGEAILRFDFANKSASTGYTIRLNFTDGTFLDITA